MQMSEEELINEFFNRFKLELNTFNEYEITLNLISKSNNKIMKIYEIGEITLSELTAEYSEIEKNAIRNKK